MDSLLPGEAGRGGGSAPARKAMGVTEFCEVMDLSRSTVHKLIRDGKIRSTKIYGKRVIDAGEPERLLNGGG
jgi:excisionase family DNA binding protein